VFLAGLQTQIDLKEYLESKYVEFEIHDRDEIRKNEIKSELGYVLLKEPEIEEEVELDKKG
jgi:hypothetical protein